MTWKGYWRKCSSLNFKVLSRHSPGAAEENHKISHESRFPVWDFNRTRSGSVNHSNVRLHPLMMESVSSFETSEKFYKTARHRTEEDSHLHTDSRENLTKSPIFCPLCVFVSLFHHNSHMVDLLDSAMITKDCYIPHSFDKLRRHSVTSTDDHNQDVLRSETLKSLERRYAICFWEPSWSATNE
jgi:hypothetical protein